MIRRNCYGGCLFGLMASSSLLVATAGSSSPSSTIASLVSKELAGRVTEVVSNGILEKLEGTDHDGDSNAELLRKLQATTEDFDEFRELFRKATIFLPDFQTSQTILFADLTVDARNIKCFDIVLGDMQITYGLVSNQRLDFRVDINDLSMLCQLDYEWVYGFFSGNGVATITLDNNYASTAVAFESPDFQTVPPESSRVESCTAIITISDMDFSGSVTDQVLNVFESLLRGYVEEAVQETVCTELDSVGTTLVQDMLVRASELLEPYLLPLEPHESNATIAESLLVVPPEINLMNFQDEGDEQTWFYRALKEVGPSSRVWLIDPNTARPSGKDLGVNIFLRENILVNGALELKVEDLPIEFDPVLFQGHDELTESTLTMTAVRIYGLDTFSNFAPFINLGKYTLQNDLSWDYLSFELDVTIDMKPSRLEESVIQGTNEDIHVVEEVTMRFGVDDINATLSVLMAIDEDAFGMLRMGPLFYEENLLPCFWSSIYKSEVTVLSATAGNIQEPAMEGFISRGIDIVVSESVKAAFIMYEGSVLQAMPNIFQLALKDTLNEAFFSAYDGVCPPVKQTEGYIDFRDLLLPAEEAPALGGSGTEPYGEMASTLFGFLKTQIATLEADGTLSANSMLIRSLTAAQSGVEGEIRLKGELFGLSAADFDWAGFDILLDGFKVSLSDVRAGNLDTLVPPFKVLEPTAEADVLDNQIHLGPVAGRPLSVSAVFSIYFGKGSPFAMNNDIALSMTSSSFEIIAQILARVEAMKLLNFPIRDLLNLQCWLATVPSPGLDEFGLRVDPAEERGIGLSQFSNQFQDLNVVVECANCTTSGLDMLPTVLELMKETEVTRVLASRLKFMVQDAAVSDTFQTVLDRMLNEASLKCPHSPGYTANVDSIGSKYDDLPLPALSELSIDTAQFLIATIVQIGFVVFTQLFAGTEVNPADALVEQQAFPIPENSSLLNFSNFELNLPEFMDWAIEEVVEMTTGTRTDPLTGQEDLAVNIFVRDVFGKRGAFVLELDDIQFGGEEVKLELHSFRVEGLDSFKNFSVGVPVAPQTILNDIAMGKLIVEADFGIRSGEVAQRIKLSFQFDDLSASVPLFAAIDRDRLMSLQVGSLLHLRKLLPCFFSAVYGFSLPHLVVNVGKIHKPRVQGLMPETDASLTALVDTLFSQYSEAMHASLPSVFDNAIRPILNRLFAFYIKENGSDCTNPILESLSSNRKLMDGAGPPFVDFRDLFLPAAASKLLGGRGDARYGDLIRSVWALVEEELLKVNPVGTSPVNTKVIAPITKAVSGSPGHLFFPGDFLSQDIKLNLGPVPTGITFRISDIHVENIDTIGDPFSLLDPVQGRPSLINNTATIGATKPLRFDMNVLVVVSTNGESIRNDFKISASFHTVTLILAALLRVSEYRFATFPIGDIFEWDCWLATLPPPALDSYGVRPDGTDASAAMEQLALTLINLDANITCVDCSSPGLQELANLWSTPEAAKEMTDAANNLLAYLSDLLGDGLVQNHIDRMINDAAKRCPHSPQYQQGFDAATYQGFKIENEEEPISLAILVMIVAGCLVACLGAFLFVIRFVVRRRHRRWLKTLPNSQLMIIKQRQEQEEGKEEELNSMSQSMFTSKSIPLLVRWVIPVVIIGNIGFFLSGHLSLGAEVTIVITVAGEVLQIENFYQFSLARSTVEIWQAGGKELAVLILIFAGIWPYTKQLISLILWFLPTSRCSISSRGSIFLWLDTLAKWSIVDIFTLVVSIAAFRLSATNPKVGFLTEDLYAFDILVVPMWGLYANLIAQLISQISSHFIIHYHRDIVHQATKAYRQKHGLVVASQTNLALTEESSDGCDLSSDDDPYGGIKDVLHSHAYSRPHRGESGKVVARSYVNFCVGFVAAVFSVLMVVGCVLPSTGLEFLGILGVAVESGQGWEQAYAKLSVFDLAKLLMNQARFTGGAKAYTGLGLLSSMLVITVLVVPVAQTAVLMYQWFTPMTGRTRHKASIAVEILQAWQYAEVYVISVVVATWQLGPISTFMINGYCQNLQETFNVMAYFGIIEDDDAQCFRVDAKIEAGSYILVVAAVLLALLNTFVMNAVKQYFRDRDDVISRAEIKERMLNQVEKVNKAENIESEGEEGSSEESASKDYWEGREDAETYIKPVPVLFTDKFRWLLRGANPVEELNGMSTHPPLGELTEKPQADSELLTSDDEQPSSPAPYMTDTANDGSAGADGLRGSSLASSGLVAGNEAEV